MKNYTLFGRWTSLAFLFVLGAYSLPAQSHEDTQDLESLILKKDSTFWMAYNSCDTEKMKIFLTDDLEFYHDKGGLTSGLATFMPIIEGSLCGNENLKLRREVVKGSVEVFPLNNYGAIISGEHVFYVIETGKEERIDAIAKFTHVWRYADEVWKMARVLSYDHQPIPQESKKEAIALSDETLKLFTGKYDAPDTGKVIISIKGKGLALKSGEMQLDILPESEHLFFHEQSTLTFEFVKDKSGKVIKFIVRENGEIAEEAKRVE